MRFVLNGNEFTIKRVCIMICFVSNFMIWKDMWRYGDSDLGFLIHIIVVLLTTSSIVIF